ncbi:dipeptide epimerase [Lactobacillus sp. ESL0684]|uniref:dipeptide epimerase n=1 Tax=Lactobacillus sp. ESL0684 TaxID=2983213 RepID=UPI0023F9D5A3|nr:dipeptide epimerase [Lactobacillus sp. ESL0684]WEV43999.1 dipeptide epimerase [Lactobacillus sp. ESL0684]
MTKITEITVGIVSLPLKTPFTTARHTVTAAQAVQVKVTLANGLIGVGTGTPNEVVTGDTLASSRAVLEDVIIPSLIGCEFEDWSSNLAILKNAIQDNQPAKAAVEFALYDLRCQTYQTSLVKLLGGRQAAVTTDMTLGIKPLDQMVAAAQEFVKQGFTTLKIKVGSNGIAADLHLIATISKAVGPQIKLRLDANQGWSRMEAAQALRELANANLPIEFVEQPLVANDIAGLKELTQLHILPIMADESAFSYQDVIRLCSEHAVDYVNIKLMKTGGLSEAEKINDICAASGISCMIGCMIEPTNSIQAAIAFAASHENVKFADLDSVYMTKEVPEGLILNGSELRIK